MKSEDVFVIITIAAILLLWGVFYLRRWITFPGRKLQLNLNDKVISDDVVLFLESEGYQVISGKKRIPLQFTMFQEDDDVEELYSRLYIDYFACPEGQEDEVYIVKVARERRPVQLTGSGIRDALLPYFLLYEEISGVLYVDMQQGWVKKILFEVEDDRE